MIASLERLFCASNVLKQWKRIIEDSHHTVDDVAELLWEMPSLTVIFMIIHVRQTALISLLFPLFL